MAYNGCQLNGIQKRAKGKLKIPPKNQINLNTLQTNLEKTNLQINNKTEIDERGKKYVSISLHWQAQKNTINIFANGKFVCWFSIPNKAWAFFIDFLNYSVIYDSLEETK